MYCLTTGTSRQSLRAIRTSRDAFRRRGVHFRIFQITHRFSLRFWRYWRSPIQDLRCLTSLALRHYSVVILNPGTSMIARPTLLRLMLLIGRAKKTRMFVRWGSCAWLLESSERQNAQRFRRGVELIRREDLLNLVLSPQA